MKLTVAGIDPGKTGAMVLLGETSSIVYRVPLMKKGKEQPAWSEWAAKWDFFSSSVDRIVIEQVGSMPGQGIASTFNFGRAYGFAHALACMSGAEIHFVTPSVWKGKLGLLKADKNASRELVRQWLPDLSSEVARVKDDGVAEAALLAYYGRKYL